MSKDKVRREPRKPKKSKVKAPAAKTPVIRIPPQAPPSPTAR